MESSDFWAGGRGVIKTRSLAFQIFKRVGIPLWVAGLVGWLSVAVVASEETSAIDAPSGRHYAPDREVDVLHLALEVTPDFKQRTIEGRATITFAPVLKPVREIKLDAVDLNIHTVTAAEKIQAFQVIGEKLMITFVTNLPPGQETSVTITYQAEPRAGLYFRTPEMGYQEGDTHLFTQGEEVDERYWYPCFDSPNEKFTSEIICHVPEGMTVISNGRLVSTEKDPATGLVAFHWTEEKPHANYLITLNAGYFKKIEDRYQNVPLAFYTPASEIAYATNSFRDTKDIMGFFEEEIGVPYAWGKYDQICVNDFVEGGMENTSATTLTDSTLFTTNSGKLRDSDGLISHEMAHQWFGDLVTCKDWSHVWLNEGFATYYATLYNGHKNGREAMIYELYSRARMITSLTNDVNPIVRRNFDGSHEMFNYLAYDKASWVLHMLRSQLGPEAYRRCIKTYLERHQYGSVVSEDLRHVIEEQTGRSYDQFFDQWLYHAHHPELEVSYDWDETTKLAKVSIRQVQKLSDDVLLFNFPLTIRFKGPFGTSDQTVQVTKLAEDFYFPLADAPEIVRLDPECTLLAKVAFPVPNAMLYAQLAAADDLAGRLLAVDQLAKKQDKSAVAHLKQALDGDEFYGVRVEASKALRSIHSDEAFAALLGSVAQPDERVRRQVLADLAGFYRDEACAAELAALEVEKNPDITAVAIRALGPYSKPATRDQLLKYLDSESFHNELAVAAVEAIRAQDDPAYIAPLLSSLPKHETTFTSRGYAQALGTLAYLARNEENKDVVREFLAGYVDSPKRPVQLGSINALGTLGDPKAVAVLDTFASASKDTPEGAAATRAITAIRAGRKPADELKDLRQEVLDLQKTTRDLRKQIDDLQSQNKAADSTKPPAPADSKSKKKPKPKPDAAEIGH
ncbi:MAG TPA: M1 family aminopeptidase [Candidatus Acidoferrales bacterium]|nr:M1 family aminopeptidase [Candidatus Acidoferrales bacterium]